MEGDYFDSLNFSIGTTCKMKTRMQDILQCLQMERGQWGFKEH